MMNVITESIIFSEGVV